MSQFNSMELAELHKHKHTNIYTLTYTHILANAVLDNILLPCVGLCVGELYILQLFNTCKTKKCTYTFLIPLLGLLLSQNILNANSFIQVSGMEMFF